jgi:outer membrane usher protein FimD/PapC
LRKIVGGLSAISARVDVYVSGRDSYRSTATHGEDTSR